MKLLSPTPHKRLNEVAGFVLLSLGITALLSLVSYRSQDPSWNTAADVRPLNLVGYPGAYVADLLLQSLGIAAFLLPPILFLLAWKWVRSEAIEAAWIKIAGNLMLVASLCGGISLAASSWTMFGGAVRVGGIAGTVVAGWLLRAFNLTGSLIVTITTFVVSVYLVSTFSMATLASWLEGPIAYFVRVRDRWRERREEKRRLKLERAKARAAEKMAALREAKEEAKRKTQEAREAALQQREQTDSTPPWETAPVAELESEAEPEPEEAEIPICPLEEHPASSMPEPVRPAAVAPPERRSAHAVFHIPPTDLLNEPPGRSPYDEQELKDTAVRVKSKFEEFNVLGSVVQINPGPVVTTFEFKPEAGIKYSRITTLTEDLCLGLQAESILIERIPGKPTVGIEVPNTRREIIALRQVVESDEFQNSPSHLTISMGKDINGRIKVAALDTMPHLLIAGSTGSGKSVMINTMIMSILYKATPDEVRMIMVDPKRLELGLYEGIPHLLTPVITDPRKATNALRNAVLEMERRLRLLAEYGVRNIDQFNKKIRKLADQPRSLFEESDEPSADELKPLPQILIIIDELADLMMLEGRNVEESVTRLAQMARAVGMHLVLATQRPSVDVITGLIKANFPARISFRVATRVDSRTILDVMGAEHLLGRGDMLFLPPGSSRLIRVHASLVTESEINEVVEFWKQQATPEYDDSFLAAPPPEDGEDGEAGEGGSDEQDPMYEDAVRIVLEMGKASTSTLQRRLRLGYGRAARILDMMYKDGIIGPPDGSKPREVLKRPDWLSEVSAR
jgi:S-DNA-T family DNA segregation ATPase FtsK/SpoIIIE